jgi:hypothetical protein
MMAMILAQARGRIGSRFPPRWYDRMLEGDPREVKYYAEVQ